MRISTSIICVVASIGFSTAATAGSMYATDGDKAAQFGTNVYNSTIGKQNPLPVSRGDVVQDTAKNLGKGQSLKDAWGNAARDNSGQKAH